MRSLGVRRGILTMQNCSLAHIVRATALDDGCFTPRTARVTLGRGRFCTELPPMSGQLWVPNAPRPEPVAINFEVRHEETTHGDSLRIVGSCPELGDWHPSEGVKLRTSDTAFPLWWLGEVIVASSGGSPAGGLVLFTLYGLGGQLASKTVVTGAQYIYII
ncbi:Hypothetical protein SCF082_LOCUS37426 [Durusdinium trenchii]|uniref:CBM20 domain-containing protein n=1 Tax=Durusdinium trenchii TaxID=1381693 RepID=A0ABP0PQX5_9DINO